MEPTNSNSTTDSIFKKEYADSVSTLSRAARLRDLATVKKLLAKGNLPQVPDNRGWTAVHISALTNQVEILETILEHKSKSKRYLSNLTTWEGETPIAIACQSERSSIEIVRVLLSAGAKLNIVTNEGLSPLHFACRKKDNVEIVKLLVEHGADVNAKEAMNGYTPLHFAVDEAIDAQLVEYLVDNCDVNVLDCGQETPLFKACAGNFSEAVELILKKDTASVNTIPLILFSPLSSAALAGNLKMVQLLLECGADTEFKGRAGIHRHSLYQKDFLPVHSSLVNIDVFKLLLKSTQPNALIFYNVSKQSATLPIYTMFYAPNTDFFEALLEHQFPDDFKDLKIANFSNLLDFVLHTRDFTQNKILEKFRMFFKYYSHFEPENVFEHFTCLMSHDEILAKHRFFHLLAKMGIPWADTATSKQLIMRLLTKLEETSSTDQSCIVETIAKLNEPVLSLKQLSRIAYRRFVRSQVEDDWSAFKIIRDSCLPTLLKDYLWYQILD